MTRVRILIVEDEAVVGMDMSASLVRKGYEVLDIVARGDAAAEKVKELRPDVILMDIALAGGTDGIEAARTIKGIADIPLIYVTSNADAETIARAGETEPYGYLNKPINERDLHTSIDSALRRHSIERQLRDSEERFRRITEAITDYIYTVTIGENGALTTAHSAGCLAVTGYTPEELSRAPEIWAGIVHEEDRPVVEKMARAILAGLPAGPIEHRIVRKDGMYRWVLNTPVPFYDRDGRLAYFDGLVRDISDRKLPESALSLSEEKFSKIFRASAAAIIITRFRDGQYIDVNDSAVQLTGYTRRDFLNNTFMSLNVYVNPGDLVRIRDGFKKNGCVQNFESEFRMKSGEIRTGLQNSETIEIGGEKCVLSSILDITDRKGMENSLRESEERFRHVIEFSPYPTAIIDAAGTISYFNTRFEEVYGYTLEDMPTVGKSMELFFPDPGNRETAMRSWHEDVSTIADSKYILRRFRVIARDGSSRSALFHMGSIGGGNLFMIAEDITERERTEMLIKQAEYRLRIMNENTKDAIFFFNMDRKLEYVNPAIEELTGYSPERFSELDITDMIHEDDRARFAQLWSGLFEGRPFSTEIRFRKKDGTTAWSMSAWSPVYGDEGGQIGAQGRESDISRLKENEDYIVRMLSEKEMLLKEIHHRVKNNLQIIISLLNLQERSSGSEEVRRHFRDSRQRIRSMSLIHEKLYQSNSFADIDLGSYIITLAEEITRGYMHAKPIELDISSDTLPLPIDQAIPCGLILNELITNAIKYAFPPEHVKNPRLTINATENPSGLIELSIRDNGVGIPESFDIKTTRSLGLSLVATLVQQLHGSIETERGEGTGITIRFSRPK